MQLTAPVEGLADKLSSLTSLDLYNNSIGDYDSSDDQGMVAWLRHGDDIVRIRRFDAGPGRLDGVTIFQRDEEDNLIVEIKATTAIHHNGGWTLQDVPRSWVGSGIVEHQDQLSWSDDLEPALLVHPRNTPWTQLFRILHATGLGTRPAYRYKLWLQERLAAPPATTIAMNLIVVALARPLRGWATQGLVITIGVGFLCWTFHGLVLTFGDLGLIPLALAAWRPVPVFLAIAWSIILHDDRRRRHRRLGAVTVERQEASG